MTVSTVLVILLAGLQTALGIEDQNVCSRTKSLFEIPGDAVLSGKKSRFRVC